MGDKSDKEMAMTYPKSGLIKAFFKTPLIGWRMGLGRLLGHLFLVLTTWGRKSGLPRRAVLEYRVRRGKIYVISGFGAASDWYQNIRATPYVTVQTWQGPESMVASRVTDEAELRDVYPLFMQQVPVAFREYLISLGIQPHDVEGFLAEKGRVLVLRFDPTRAPTPPPLEADLLWVWPVALMIVGSLWLFSRRHPERTCV